MFCTSNNTPLVSLSQSSISPAGVSIPVSSRTMTYSSYFSFIPGEPFTRDMELCASLGNAAGSKAGSQAENGREVIFLMHFLRAKPFIWHFGLLR